MESRRYSASAYYEDLILNRAGLLTRDEYLERARSNIVNYESIPGHLFQSASAFGALTEDRGGNPVISSVEWDSPAWRAGLSAQDEILAVDAVRVTSRALAGTGAVLHPWGPPSRCLRAP